MNKIEPNMYVRTLFGIKKIDHINNKKTVWKYLYKINDDNEFYALSDNDVIKASYNIIDLIEVGDVITTNNLCGQVTCIDGDKIYTTCYDGDCCYDYQIQSIVTKEQFSSMEYRLGE